MAQTLRQMAGADLNPHKLANSAVLMIDAQLEYVSGRMPCDGVEAALEQDSADRQGADGRTAGHSYST